MQRPCLCFQLLVQIADDFIDNVVNNAAQLAKHRKSSNIEVKDVQVHLERSWNMWIPGFGSSEEPKPYKKQATTEAHKQVSVLATTEAHKQVRAQEKQATTEAHKQVSAQATTEAHKQVSAQERAGM